MYALYSIRKMIARPGAIVFILCCLSLFFVCPANAVIELMEDEELEDVNGQFSEIRLISHNNSNDTIRFFLDIHQEVYGTIETARLGYYYKDASELRNTPVSIGLSGFEGFYHGADNVNNGANFQFLRITSDFNTMAPQNGATLEPWGNGGIDSGDVENTTTANSNNFDWDLWIDNLQLGESPDKPQVMNGLIMRFEFTDDLTANPDAKLERIVIGSNDLQGNLYINPWRLTGSVNPLLLTNSTNRSAGAVDPYKYTAGNVMIQRDPLIQCFGVNVHNVEDRDTGAWLVIDMSGDHLGYTFVAGWPENGTNFNYAGGEGNTGYANIPLWDPSWAPGAGISSGLGGSDPYNTARQDEYASDER